MTSSASVLLERMLVHEGEIRMRRQRLGESRRQHRAPVVTEMTGDASIDDMDLRNPNLLDAALEAIRLLDAGVLLQRALETILDGTPSLARLAPQCDRYQC